MAAIFPTLGTEELLYSGIARLGDMMGYQSVAALWRSLYGKCPVRPEVDICGPLGSLLHGLPPGHDLSAEQIIREHTLVPYHTFSMNPSRKAEIVDTLSTTGPRPTGSVLGLGRWSVKPPAHLRYCPTCAEEDWQGNIGVSYWRRVHQLPGVVTCPHHGQPLVVTRIGRSVHAKPRDFISLRRALGRTDNSPCHVPKHLLKRCTGVARDTLWILQNSHLADGELPRRHRSWHMNKGWVHTVPHLLGQFNYAAFISAFRASYEEDSLRLLCEGKDSLLIPSGGGWVRRITLPSCFEQAFHPLQHILLWQFLKLSPEAFFRETPTIHGTTVRSETAHETSGGDEYRGSTVGSAGGIVLDEPCLNPICTDYDSAAPRTLDIPASVTSGRVTVFCKACEFTYTQRPECEEKMRIRIKHTGPLWDKQLICLLGADLSLRTIAERLGFSRYVVQKHAIRLGVWRDGWSEQVRQRADTKSKRKKRQRAIKMRKRETWLRLQEQFPNASRTELRKKASRTSEYLVNFDAEWYESNSPAERPAFGNREEGDWRQRDAETRDAAQVVVKKIREQDEVVRITRLLIARRVGQETTLHYGLQRMPKTKQYISGVVETHEQFAVRRLCYSIQHFINEAGRVGIPMLTKFRSRAGCLSGSSRELSVGAYRALLARLEDNALLPQEWRIENYWSTKKIDLPREPDRYLEAREVA